MVVLGQHCFGLGTSLGDLGTAIKLGTGVGCSGTAFVGLDTSFGLIAESRVESTIPRRYTTSLDYS